MTATPRWVEPERAGFVAVNRARLRVWEWGDESAPPVICAHGGHDHGRMWDEFAPRVAALGYRVVAPDLRGHGDSSRVPSGHVWSACTLDLAGLARHLGPPVGVIGHSFGSGQVMWMTAVFPELVRWVVSLDGLGPPAAALEREITTDIVTAATAGLDAFERTRARPPKVYASARDMVERRRKTNPRLPDAWLHHLVRHGSRPVEGGLAWKSDPMFNVGLPGEFSLDHLLAEHALIDRPLLALTGAEPDTWSDLDNDEIAARIANIRGAQHAVVRGAGHYVHLEQPDVVFDRVRAFVQSVDGPVAA